MELVTIYYVMPEKRKYNPCFDRFFSIIFTLHVYCSEYQPNVIHSGMPQFSIKDLAKIIERDSKDATYKYALLRGTIEVIQENDN